MEFEYDEDKSRKNREKHGIDFIEIQQLWEDQDRTEIPAKTEDEPRYLVVGKIGNKHWSIVITYREQKIRIISARRSRQEEIRIYEGEKV